MDTLRNYKDLKAAHQDHVIVIGNFDGVHRGHRKLIEMAKDMAAAKGKKCGILTFEPHPRSLFRPDDKPFRITPFPLKEEKLAEAGIDTLYALEFNWDFASQSAEDFIKHVLAGGLMPAHTIVGYDFRFGQLRKGEPQTMIDAGLPVTIIEKLDNENGEAFSSSAIRTALRHGDIEAANAMLGWEWGMRGVVVKGDQRGRELGYPTANVRLEDTIHPLYGVYATLVQIAEDGPDAPWLPAATNIGIRPMFELSVGQIEAHILDFHRDIYGKTLRVKPVQKLRGEAKFDSLEALIRQIETDCTHTRDILDAADNETAPSVKDAQNG